MVITRFSPAHFPGYRRPRKGLRKPQLLKTALLKRRRVQKKLEVWTIQLVIILYSLPEFSLLQSSPSLELRPKTLGGFTISYGRNVLLFVNPYVKQELNNLVILDEKYNIPSSILISPILIDGCFRIIIEIVIVRTNATKFFHCPTAFSV